MKALLACLLLLLGLAGCQASSHAHQTRTSEPYTDSAARVTVTKRTLKDKVMGRPARTYEWPADKPLRIGKKSQVTITTIHGDGNTVKTAQAEVGKVKSAAAINSDSAQVIDQRKATNAAVGDGNTQTAPQAPGWKAVLAEYAGVIISVLLLGAIVYFLLIPLRRRSQPPT